METGAAVVNFPLILNLLKDGKLPAATPHQNPPYRKSGKMRLSILLS